ncbi:MAG TPA: aminopeptidase P family protein [Pyrinomonadaceae bacterium]|jgi:Xaa-Pro aminopeptidase
MKKFFALVSFISISTTVFPFNAKAETPKPEPPSAIRPTPPAPKISDAERQKELAARRARVLSEMKDNSVMILMSAAPKVYTNDVDFLYRQENNLYYLTNLKQPNATLVLVKSGGATQEFLFVPKRNPQFETWNGHMYSAEEVAAISGIKNIIEASEFEDRKDPKDGKITKGFFTLFKEKQPFAAKSGGFSFTPNAENLYLLTPEIGYETQDTREYQREWDLAQNLSKATLVNDASPVKYEKTGPYQIVSANSLFEKLRSIKSPYEIRMMQHAIDISTEAHMRAMATVKQVKWEYETQAEIEYVFRRRNADYWGYPSIVGCGPNATTLHYVESQGEVKPGTLMLIDVGAEYDHITADITRTFPANGKFTKEQAEIYQIVYDAQETAAAAMKPGRKFSEPNQASRKTVEEGLVKLGLITAVGAFIPGTEQQVPDGKGGTRTVGMPQSFVWYMHGLGHWLGMNVHDVGGGGNTVFQPGMVMTNEPGIYIREDALDYFDVSKPGVKEWLDKIRPAFEKYKNIGVRIEDDMLITETGVEWLSKALPRKLEDVEFFMAKASNGIKIGALDAPEKPRLAFSAQNAELLKTGFQSADVFASTTPTSGKTVRYGWTYSGKNTAYSALRHARPE